MPRKKRPADSNKPSGNGTPPPTEEDFLQLEAKAFVALTFRNGPLEDLHTGKKCPTCSGKEEFSKISDPEMKVLMKTTVNRYYSLFKLMRDNPKAFQELIWKGHEFTYNWDPVEVVKMS